VDKQTELNQTAELSQSASSKLLDGGDTLKHCLKALGWQGGTIHQVLRVLNYSRILVESHDNALATGDWEEFKSKIEQLKLAFKA